MTAHRRQPDDAFSSKQQQILASIRPSRIVWPILLGVGVVAYLMWQQFDAEDFRRIPWSGHALAWIGIALLVLVGKHLAYAYRLWLLSDGEFSFLKCVELIFIWEFSSAVSPTSVGGSAVALFVLSQEKLSTARTATVVLYTVVLDSAFFIFSLPLLFLIFGPSIIRPGLESIRDFDAWGWTFVGAYALMLSYGSLFAWGLFRSPRRIKRLLLWATGNRLLRRFRRQALETGNDMLTASRDLRGQPWAYHVRAFAATAVAWSCRFFILNALIIAFVPATPLDMATQWGMYARMQAMFLIVAFSPTPGGAGFVEVLFGGFLVDYVPGGKALSLVMASIWRLLTYYSYLIAGAIIIPRWLRGVLLRRKLKKEQKSAPEPIAKSQEASAKSQEAGFEG